ncbi:MAG: hypothetical protein K8F35_07655, partial [Dokdonella sp.]|uniref:hypothetical protein n=1 Tax=Dokdonella sp. TaxID=2291710 RepID=UPI0025BC894B
ADLERITREIEPRLRGLRESMDEELGLMARDVERLADELIERARRGLGACVRAIKSDVVNVGTPDLPERRRAAGRMVTKAGRGDKLFYTGDFIRAILCGRSYAGRINKSA